MSKNKLPKLRFLNKNFRRSNQLAIDHTAYSAQSNGEEAKNTRRNTLVPPTFVQVGDKAFGETVSSKLVNYGTQWSNMNLEDAQTATSIKKKAQAQFAEAKN